MASPKLSRRTLLQTGVVAGLSSLPLASKAAEASGIGRPASAIAVSSANGLRATARAFEVLSSRGDPVDAAVQGVSIVESDPNDMSVGFGGLPNEFGVVELDACVMHGPTMRAGAVGALRNIKNPSQVAKVVMERTDHVFLVGEGALQFARLMGFKEEELLTERARQAWLRWKTRLSNDDDWLDDDEIRADFQKVQPTSTEGSFHRPTGTISCLCLTAEGELGGCTTTSGLAYKIPGRVGDSPIIGAGLYVDGEVGACGSTGRGEANILSCGGRTVVENMKRGLEPAEAILDVLKRVCEQTKSPRLLHKPGFPNFDLNFYALRKDGAFAGGRIYKGGNFAVHDGTTNKLHESVYLYERA